MEEVQNKNLTSADLLPILKLDSFSQKDLIGLKEDLFKINANRIWIIDNYNSFLEKSSEDIDLRYDENMNGLNFFYRIYQMPLDSLPYGSYRNLISDDTTGGILNKNIIWYYR